MLGFSSSGGTEMASLTRVGLSFSTTVVTTGSLCFFTVDGLIGLG